MSQPVDAQENSTTPVTPQSSSPSTSQDAQLNFTTAVTPKPSSSSSSQDSLVAYVHELTDLKTSANNNTYFNLKLQTAENESIRAVCYSPDKHKTFKASAEKSSPIKLSNFHRKKNKYSEEEEVHINKRSKLMDASEEEVKFDYKSEQSFDDESFTPVAELLIEKKQRRVNVRGRVTFKGPQETCMSKQKTLLKQEAFLTDETGSIRLVLWETDIAKIISNTTYQMMKVKVRAYQDEPYITLNMQSLIIPLDLQISREDDQQLLSEHIHKSVDMPAEGVRAITKYFCCNTCRTKIDDTDKKKVKCSQCGISQLKEKCPTRLYVKAKFLTATKESVDLVIFDDKLRVLHSINEHKEAFELLSEEDLEDLLLEGKGTILYNNKYNVISITKM